MEIRPHNFQVWWRIKYYKTTYYSILFYYILYYNNKVRWRKINLSPPGIKLATSRTRRPLVFLHLFVFIFQFIFCTENFPQIQRNTSSAKNELENKYKDGSYQANIHKKHVYRPKNIIQPIGTKNSSNRCEFSSSQK